MVMKLSINEALVESTVQVLLVAPSPGLLLLLRSLPLRVSRNISRLGGLLSYAIISRIFVDASVPYWGQIKTRKFYLINL